MGPLMTVRHDRHAAAADLPELTGSAAGGRLTGGIDVGKVQLIETLAGCADRREAWMYLLTGPLVDGVQLGVTEARAEADRVLAHDPDGVAATFVHFLQLRAIGAPIRGGK